MGWSLITTSPNSETRASEMLVRLGFVHKVFRVRRRVALRGKIAEKLFPYFPGYIFVEARKCWDEIRSVSSVVDFVRFGTKIAEVAESEVNKLLKSSDSNGVLYSLELEKGKFSPGQKVVVSGTANVAFGRVGVYQYSVSPGKAYVLMPWFNDQLVGTIIKEEALEAYEYRRSNRKRKRRRRGRHRSLVGGTTHRLSRPEHHSSVHL